MLRKVVIPAPAIRSLINVHIRLPALINNVHNSHIPGAIQGTLAHPINIWD